MKEYKQFFRRFLTLAEKSNPASVSVLKEVLADKPLTHRSIEENFSDHQVVYLKDIYELEKAAFDHFYEGSIQQEEIMASRMNAIGHIQQLMYGDEKKILNTSFQINHENILMESKWYWGELIPPFYAEEEIDDFLEEALMAPPERHFTLLKPSIINERHFDEVSLVGTNKILAAIWECEDTFNGFEILDMVNEDEFQIEFVNMKGPKWKSITDFILNSVVYYNALHIVN